MKITKKQLIALFFSLAYCLPVAFSHYLALPARADEALVGEQIGLQEVKPLFGGGRAEEDFSVQCDGRGRRPAFQQQGSTRDQAESHSWPP